MGKVPLEKLVSARREGCIQGLANDVFHKTRLDLEREQAFKHVGPILGASRGFFSGKGGCLLPSWAACVEASILAWGLKQLLDKCMDVHLQRSITPLVCLPIAGFALA